MTTTNDLLTDIQDKIKEAIRYAEADIQSANESEYEADKIDAEYRKSNLQEALILIENSEK